MNTLKKDVLMRQVTLVMLYGPKPSDLSCLIAECQKRIVDVLGDNFQPYDINQVHATLVSLRQVPGSNGYNLNLDRYRDQQATMNFAGLLDSLRHGNQFPLRVQIGGFEKRDYPFMSQGQIPYERSFSILGNIALLAGWPIHKELDGKCSYPSSLDEVRKSFQQFNILHKYHPELTDVDNDFYVRLGTIRQEMTDHSLRMHVESTIKSFLSKAEPIIIEITVSDVYVASFQNETLPPNSTEIWSISVGQVTTAFIWDLYKEALPLI